MQKCLSIARITIIIYWTAYAGFFYIFFGFRTIDTQREREDNKEFIKKRINVIVHTVYQMNAMNAKINTMSLFDRLEPGATNCTKVVIQTI